MRPLLTFCLFLGMFFVSAEVSAQKSGSEKIDSSARIYVIVKNDGTEFVGKILSQDAREVLIETKDRGQIIIPKHEIKSIRELESGDMNANGEYIGKDVFATRYFLTTNGLPLEKGQGYIQWNLYGPDLQFGITNRFSAGITTSWVGFPIIGNAKYSFQLGPNTHLGVGTLLGTGSWAAPDFGIALPFGSLTLGNKTRNLTFSGGYGAIFGLGTNEGRGLMSIAGMAKVGKKISLVFDSFILPATANGEGFAILVPGLRIHTGQDKAFQFGFMGAAFDGELIPIPIPVVQWYRKL